MEGEMSEADRVAQLMSSWQEVEPRVARLANGQSDRAFYRRLLGEYRVAMQYTSGMLADGLRRYGRQLQLEGLRAMTFDPVAGAAEYVIGANIESSALTTKPSVYERTRALIDHAACLFGERGAGGTVARP